MCGMTRQSLLQLRNVGKENVLFLEEMRSQFPIERSQRPLHGGQVRLGVAVPAHHLLRQHGQSRQLAFDVVVVSGNDMVDQLGQGSAGPVTRWLVGCFRSLVERGQQRCCIDASSLAGLGQRLLAAATVVDAEFFKDANGSGLREGNLAHGQGKQAHGVSPSQVDSRRNAPGTATLVTLTPK